jgi:hypothetical protein
MRGRKETPAANLKALNERRNSTWINFASVVHDLENRVPKPTPGTSPIYPGHFPALTLSSSFDVWSVQPTPSSFSCRTPACTCRPGQRKNHDSQISRPHSCPVESVDEGKCDKRHGSKISRPDSCPIEGVSEGKCDRRPSGSQQIVPETRQIHSARRTSL